MIIESNKEPHDKFFVETPVSLAKSAVFFASAEIEMQYNNFTMAIISAYYSLFHLGLTLMWMLPQYMPEDLHRNLIEIRDRGEELPDKSIKHKDIKNFLSTIQKKLPDSHLVLIYQRALKLREFVNYGPRVYYDGKQPLVGPCDSTIRDVREVVDEIPEVFFKTIKDAATQTVYNGDLTIYIIVALDLLRKSEFPFIGWFPTSVLNRAEEFIKNLNDY